MDYDGIVEYLYDEFVENEGCGLTMYGAYLHNGTYCDFNILNLKGKDITLEIDNIPIKNIGDVANKISIYRQDCTISIEDIGLTIENVESVRVITGDN